MPDGENNRDPANDFVVDATPTPAISNSCTDDDGDGYYGEIACPSALDCDDSNGDVNPGATEGPVGHATCSDTFDNDCDGKTDTDDRDCKEGGCLASAAASIYETDSVGESTQPDHVAYVLVSLAIVGFLLVVRRRK